MGRTRTAVVGLNMGMKHAQAYTASDKSELKWVVDLDQEKAAQAAEQLGCSYTTDWEQVLDDVDAISICTPHHLHAPQAMRAIHAGKHVLLEKPLANTEEDCQKIINAAEEKKVTLMLAYIARFLPALVRLKEVLDKEEFGKPFSIQCWVQAYLPPQPGSWFSQKEKLGGGVLFSHGCHYVDLMLWFMGDAVKVSSLGTRSGTEWMEGEGTSHSIMEFSNGAVGHLVASWGMKHIAAPARFHIHTPQALLIVDNKMSKLEALTAEGKKTIFEAPAPGPGTNAFWEIEHFLTCIESGKTPDVDGHEALKSHRTIWKMYESMR